MSGEDDLRARLTALADEWEHPAEVYALRKSAAPRLRALLAPPAEPARESDGVGLRDSHASGCGFWLVGAEVDCTCADMPGRLREDERRVLTAALQDEVDHPANCTCCPGLIDDLAPTVERIIAARVAEAGARALEEAADASLDIAFGANEDVRDWLRDRARGLRR